MNKWHTIRADKFCFDVTDGTHDSPKSQTAGRKLITSKHLKGYYIDFDSANWISEADYQKVITRSRVEQWDILYSMIGTIGNMYLEKNPVIDYACKNMGIFKFNGNISDAYWMYYYLKSPQAIAYINSHLRGSTQSYVPLGGLREMPVPVPPVEIRLGIISILHSIDDKIENNQKINDNLHELLQSVYQSRFGLPKVSSGVGMLSEICDYTKNRIAVSEIGVGNYYSTENMLPNKAGFIDATSLPTTPQTTKCNIGDVLISNIRPYFKKIVFCQSEGGCSADVLCFTPRSPSLSAYLFCTLYADRFFDFIVAGSKGTKMPRGDKQQIMTYPVVIPTDTELSDFTTVAQPILNQIHNIRSENTRLATLRDTLLPKLMSGEIDVSDIQI